MFLVCANRNESPAVSNLLFSFACSNEHGHAKILISLNQILHMYVGDPRISGSNFRLNQSYYEQASKGTAVIKNIIMHNMRVACHERAFEGHV